MFDRCGIPARFTRPEEERLEAESDKLDVPEGFIAFPTPAGNESLSILGLRTSLGVGPRKAPCFFDHPWYLAEAFARRSCHPGWHVLSTTILEDSANQPVYYVERLTPDGRFLTGAVELALMLFVHHAVTGERLLQRKHTWTLDRTADGRFVSVGAFGEKGLFVSSHEAGYKSRGLGICPEAVPFGPGGV